MPHQRKGTKPLPIECATWIAPSYPTAAPIFTKNFRMDSLPKQATLYISGLGYFEFLINGERITSDRLIPVASDYLKRDFRTVTYPVRDTFTHRIYYYTYDLTPFLRVGENTLEITCGGGFFVQKERIAEGHMSYADRPMCLFAITLDETTILSDGSEMWRESEIRYCELFIGERIDYTFRDGEPKPVITLPSPDSILSPSIGVPDRIIRTIKPSLVYQSENMHIYDIGENISALVSLTTTAPCGTCYTLRFSENLAPDKTLDFKSTGASYTGTSGEHQIMKDVFITDGQRRTFMPHFTWHAFRYFEISGNLDAIEDLTVCVIHANISPKCEFNSDSEGLNFLFDAYIRTQLSNYHGSFPSDCPHRERLGYTGDGQITARAAMMMLDSKELYRKWIRDILDSQDKETGHVQHTAPFQGGGGGPGGWCSAIVTVPYAFAKEFGYDSILDDALPGMLRWIRFTESCTLDGLVVRESEGGWCLGDWCALDSAILPEPFVNSCWLIHALRLYCELSVFLGHTPEEDVIALEQRTLAATKAAYASLRGIGAAMAYAAWIGIEDAAHVAAHYGEKGHFDTGFLGTDILCDVLFKNGYGEVAYRLFTSEQLGSFLYMKRRGASTLWENWRGDNSHSHPMFGACARQLFEGILGIRQPKGSFGYEQVTVTPCLPEGMQHVEGKLTTPRGIISVKARRTANGVCTEIDIPKK